MTAFLSDVRGTIWQPDAKHGPLPRVLLSMTLVTGLVDAFSYLLHAPIFYPLAAAFVVIVLGAATTGVLGRPDPAWVREPPRAA